MFTPVYKYPVVYKNNYLHLEKNADILTLHYSSPSDAIGLSGLQTKFVCNPNCQVLYIIQRPNHTTYSYFTK